jgi:hypothetical protein
MEISSRVNIFITLMKAKVEAKAKQNRTLALAFSSA